MATSTSFDRKLRLAIVDDDPAIVRLVSAWLTGAHGERLIVHDFTDPREAMRWLDHECCDVILTDLIMPGVNGLELLRFAKQRNPWTQAIVLTAHSTWNSVGEALEQGASDYLVKPIKREELVELIRQTYERFARWQLAAGRSLTHGRAQSVTG